MSDGLASTVFIIDIGVKNADALFTSFDPSPFYEHTLNRTTSQYIANLAAGAGKHDRFLIRLTVEDWKDDDVSRMREAVHVHFRHLADTTDQELKSTLRDGMISLAIGMSILAVCTALLIAVENRMERVGLARFFTDGLAVLGWVANWRPIQLLFYDWWPIRRDRDLYKRLALADVMAPD